MLLLNNNPSVLMSENLSSKVILTTLSILATSSITIFGPPDPIKYLLSGVIVI